MKFWEFLFDTTSWPARWRCGAWTDTLGWIHIFSDLGIFFAYISIPAVLIYWCIKRRDIPFNYILILFALFIVFCGSGHLIEAIIFWKPVYRFDALVKFSTAVISWVTVLALIPVIPKVLDFPKIEKLNEILSKDLLSSNKKLSQTVQELQNANKEMENFLYVVSHDLRAPLINIKGFSQELSHAFSDITPHLDNFRSDKLLCDYSQEIPQALKFISGSVQKIDNLIEALLKLSRLGKNTMVLEEICTKDLVQEQILALSHQIKRGNITVVIGNLPNVIADKTSMQQIFGNLLDNAIKYQNSKVPGKIEVYGETLSDCTKFYVQDNGIGIHTKDSSKVFEIFKRIDPTATPGEGMGLAYIKTLVKRHQGNIDFTSKFKEGSLFFFSIPNNLKLQEEANA